nr:uncharacterized protein LOC110355019 [Columba livia]
MGPDGIHPRVLKELAGVTAGALAIILQRSGNVGQGSGDKRQRKIYAVCSVRCSLDSCGRSEGATTIIWLIDIGLRGNPQPPVLCPALGSPGRERRGHPRETPSAPPPPRRLECDAVLTRRWPGNGSVPTGSGRGQSPALPQQRSLALGRPLGVSWLPTGQDLKDHHFVQRDSCTVFVGMGQVNCCRGSRDDPEPEQQCVPVPASHQPLLRQSQAKAGAEQQPPPLASSCSDGGVGHSAGEFGENKSRTALLSSSPRQTLVLHWGCCSLFRRARPYHGSAAGKT